MLIDIVTYVLCFLLGYYIATIVFMLQIAKAFKKIYKEQKIQNIIEDTENGKVNVIPILFAQTIQDENILLYDVDNNFMCQGKTFEELAINLKINKKIDFAIILHEEDKFYFNDGKIQKAL